MVFLSALFVLSSITSLTLGANSLINNRKDRLNKVFFILTSNISAWSFTYALMNIAQDVETATAFHRTGALFYCSMYAIFLHFIILLTNSEKYFKTKAYHFLLYLPALISIWLYYFYKPVSTADHFKTSLGWVYVYPKYNNLVLDYFFHVYYISYTAFGLYLLVLWYKKATYTREKMQAKIMIFTIILPFLIGSVTDIVIPLMRKVFLPPISAVLFNIPIICIWYAMAKYKQRSKKQMI